MENEMKKVEIVSAYKNVEILNVEVRNGYILRTEKVMDREEKITLKVAYDMISGIYVGNEQNAKYLYDEQGLTNLQPRKEGGSICSIGFNEEEQKWYGWSHRAIYGFGIGSSVKKGDCAYKATNLEEEKEKAISFWSYDGHENVRCTGVVEEEGEKILKLEWEYSEDPEKITNEKIRGTSGGTTWHFSDDFGKGEWIATTLEEAKQMAKDYADEVS